MKWPRMKDYPHEIEIKPGVWWQIRFRRKIMHDGKRVYGLCHSNERLIEIRMGMHPKFRYEIFWHELIHALEYTYEFSVPHNVAYWLQGPLATFSVLNKKVA